MTQAIKNRITVLQRSQAVGATANASLSYAYDLADRITQITYPSGRSVRYGYDGKGRVSGVETRSASAATWVTLASNMTYRPFGSVETMTLGNGLIAANDRGLDGWLKARRLTNASSAASPVGTKLSDISYGYDPDGNVTSMDDKVTPARSSLYGYDAGGRVNMMVADPGSGSGAGASNAPANYSYTQGTNKLASLTTTVAGGAAGSAAATRSIQYDARGNPSGETRSNGAGSTQAVTIAYDGHGRMTSYARSGEVALTHSYNGNDDRVATTTTSASTATPDTRRFVYAPDGRVLGEYGSSASDVKAEFIWMSPEVGASGSFGGDDGLSGYMPLAVAANDNVAGPQLLWVHANHMGVPAVYTNASGAAITPPSGYSAPGFPGQSRTLGDLYYNRYRDYDPTTGRYIQADPIGLAGGASPYSYAMNNPLRYSDPTGEIVPILVGAAIGAGLEYLTNECATASDIILAGALGGIGGGFGGAATLRYGPRALTRVTGKEWSHAIPKRWIKKLPDWAKGPMNKRDGYKGNWVTPKRHFKHDPYRYPKGSGGGGMGNRLPLGLREFDRIPDWMKASAASGGGGAAAAGNNCGC